MTHALNSSSLPSDESLIERVANGDLQALGALFDRHEAPVRRFLGRLGVAAHDADDLVQATFLEVVRAAPRFDVALSAKCWLFGIAVILVRRHRRSLSRAAAQLLRWARTPHEDSPITPAAQVERDQELLRFQRALDALPAKKREVFTLVTLEGLHGEEAARTLGIPVATVRTRLHHARLELRAALAEEP
ncbi:MAG: RNA polymerase sigma factor [Polyangiaceae bacterium]